ncbi:MAG: protein kinase domain-containing protein, partial [Candidatus Rokuibacteriota bacterium]
MRGHHRGGLSPKDRYRLVRRLSEDPIGAIWLARDLSVGPMVTIRVLRDELVADERFTGRLRSELRAAWPRLKHRNVPSVIGYPGDREGQIRFVVMKAFQGETLAQRIRRGGPLAPGEATRIASQVEAALDAAHDIGLVHGGVTAHSVVLAPGGDVKVLDFGIPTALRVAARDLPRPRDESSNGSPAGAIRREPDPAHDARSLERLMQSMHSGAETTADDELPSLVSLMLAARPASSATAPRPSRRPHPRARARA